MGCRKRFIASIVVVICLGVVAFVFFSRARANIPFPHGPHAVAGVACEVCHATVRLESFAGRPSTITCRMCHKDDREHTRVEAPPQAEPRISLPDHVFFSHRRHVGVALIGCGVCHGDVGVSAAVPRTPPIDPSMDFCLSCHATAGASMDCIACHR